MGKDRSENELSIGVPKDRSSSGIAAASNPDESAALADSAYARRATWQVDYDLNDRRVKQPHSAAGAARLRT